jgi:plastocyanin
MRKLLSAAAIAAATAALAVPALAATKTIKVGDDYFVKSGARPTVTVHKGTTVAWVWRGKVAHNVFVLRGPQKFHSRTFVKGSYKHRMTRKGTYKIVCTIHSGMEMTLKVR